jgi:hypothetical protein
LKLIFLESEVAGYKAAGQVTRERLKKALPVGTRGHRNTATQQNFWIQDDLAGLVPTISVVRSPCAPLFSIVAIDVRNYRISNGPAQWIDRGRLLSGANAL